jgi:hypothetical protein
MATSDSMDNSDFALYQIQLFEKLASKFSIIDLSSIISILVGL